MTRAGARRPLGLVSWLATSFKDGFTVFQHQAEAARPDEPRLVILVDLDAHPEPNPMTLRNLFGFTAAETRLAIELAQGRTLNEIARSHQLSRTTIRSQLASLFVKTQTSRQSELIALLGRVTLMP
jgi:DNA-binding CsgD family transcriptional regulator